MVWIRENLLGSARKPIAEIAVGDEVASWNPLTDSANYARVTGKSSRLAPYALRLTLADAAGKTETVTVTPGHPYLIAANDNAPGPHLVVMQPAGHWTAARYLKAGEKIASATGTPVSVVSTEVDSNPLRVYDLEVENLHSFAVGEQGPWVHNAGIPNSDPRLTILYELFDAAGNFLKHGITCNPDTRYPKKYKYFLKPVDSGGRTDMLKKEREKVERNPGPRNRERWARR